MISSQNRDPRVKPEDDIIEIPRSGRRMTQGLWNSRIFVIASEAKQSLGILDLSLRILEFILFRNSRIPKDKFTK